MILINLLEEVKYEHCLPGVIRNGVWHEINLARKNKKQVRYFSVGKKISGIKEVGAAEVSSE